MEGHLFAPAIEDPDLAPPFVALLVSGGHTLLLDVPAWGRYRLLGQTRDDAAGEAFDKVGTLLGLEYPGGPAIERLAPHGDPARFTFPRPMRDDGFEFSFSGLKTAVLHAVRASGDLERDRPHLARAFQDAVLDVLVTKLERAVRATGYRTAVLGGGVACSRALAALAAERLSGRARVAVASPRLNADNSAVIRGSIGTKWWYVLFSGEWDSLFRRGGFVWYGGFLGGVVAVLLNGWRKGAPARWTCELTATAVPLGHALGRVGCFLVNDDYGIPSTLPWAMKFPQGLPPTTVTNLTQMHVRFPPGADPAEVVAAHPTQIYETALMMLAFARLWRRRDRPHLPVL